MYALKESMHVCMYALHAPVAGSKNNVGVGMRLTRSVRTLPALKGKARTQRTTPFVSQKYTQSTLHYQYQYHGGTQ